MPDWAFALLLKPVLGALLVLFVFVIPIWFCRKVLKPIFPEGKLKDELFREAVDESRANSTSGAADPTKRLLD